MNQTLKFSVIGGPNYGGVRMLNGGMQTFKLFFFILLPILTIIGIVIIFNFGIFWNILTHGTITGPCVWPSDYEAMGEDLEDLEYDSDLECYVRGYHLNLCAHACN